MRAWTNKIDMWERKWVLKIFIKILGKFWQMMEGRGPWRERYQR